MGLSAATGILVDLTAGGDSEGVEHHARDFERINEILREEELPTWEEPRYGFDPLDYELAGYTTLHHLRRIAAHCALGHPLPAPWGEGSDADAVVEDYYDRAERNPDVALGFEHLMVHSDAEGYYVPVPMTRPVFLEDDDGVAGMTIGSSIALLDELEALAQALEIPADLGADDERLVQALQGGGEATWQRHGGAAFACVRLREVARASATHRAAIVFC